MIYISELIELIKYSNVDIRQQFNLALEKNMIVYSDPSRMRVILNNLLSNSIKYAMTIKANR